MAAQEDPDRLAEPQADRRLVDILTLRNRFDHYLREAARERKRGRYDSEESLRNKASDLAVQIIATQARFINTEVTCLTQAVSTARVENAVVTQERDTARQERDTLRAKYERVVLFFKEEAARDVEKIETLRAENERLKAALHSIAQLLTAYRARETPQNAVRTVDAISDVITTVESST